MKKQKLWCVTAYETVRVTRSYTAKTAKKAIAKMSEWVEKREDEGREFSGTLKIEPQNKTMEKEIV